MREEARGDGRGVVRECEGGSLRRVEVRETVLRDRVVGGGRKRVERRHVFLRGTVGERRGEGGDGLGVGAAGRVRGRGVVVVGVGQVGEMGCERGTGVHGGLASGGGGEE